MEKLEMHKKCHTPRPHLTKYLNSKNRKRNFLAKHMQGSTNLLKLNLNCLDNYFYQHGYECKYKKPFPEINGLCLQKT